MFGNVGDLAVLEEKENDIAHVDLLLSNSSEDILYAGLESEAFFEAVDWQRSNFLPKNVPHCYDYPLQCEFCKLWLKNQAVLSRHLADSQHCRVVQGLVHSILGKRRQCAEQKRFVHITPQLHLLEVELALLSQLRFSFSSPIGTPVFCVHCNAFFMGRRCLVEHLGIIAYRTRPPFWLEYVGLKKFRQYGDFVTTSLKETEKRKIRFLPGIDIKFPILSSQCSCTRLSSATAYVRPTRKQFLSVVNDFKWYALTSAAVLSDCSRARVLKRLYALPTVTDAPSALWNDEMVLLRIINFIIPTSASRVDYMCVVNVLFYVAKKLMKKRVQTL